MPTLTDDERVRPRVAEFEAADRYPRTSSRR